MLIRRLKIIRFAVMLAMAAALPGEACAAEDDVAAYKRAVDKSFAAWLEALWPDAEAAGVKRATFETNIKGLKLNWSLPHLVFPDPATPDGPPLPKVLADQMKPSRQPEFEPPAGYFKDSTLNMLAATGRSKMNQLGPQLAAIQKKYNVPASIIVAIWGRETGFGSVDMPFDALSAIATQAFMGLRQDEFRKQLIIALKILQEGHATRADMRSSWAGAMGYTQFLPSDFDNYAVDFDGDGKRDIWNTISDALPRRATRCTAKAGTAIKPGVTRSGCRRNSIARSRAPTKRAPLRSGSSSASRA